MTRRVWFLFLFLGFNLAQAKDFRVPVDPQAPVRSKYQHRELGGIAVSDDFIVALTSRGWMVKVSPEGKVLWRMQTGCRPVTGPALDDTNLYYACAEGILISRNLQDGKENWRFKYQDSSASIPGFSPDLLIFQSGSGMIFFLNKAEGSLKSISKQTGRTSLSMLGASPPLVNGASVYLGLLDGWVAELKLEDGSLVWEKQIFNRPIVSDIDNELAADRDTIYAASIQGVCALSKKSGKVFWCVNKDLAGDIAQDQDFIYAITRDQELLIIDKIAGIVEKKIPLKKSILEKWYPEKLLWISKDEDRMIWITNSGVWELKPNPEKPNQIMNFANPIRAGQIYGNRLYLINSKGYLISKDMK